MWIINILKDNLRTQDGEVYSVMYDDKLCIDAVYTVLSIFKMPKKEIWLLICTKMKTCS